VKGFSEDSNCREADELSHRMCDDKRPRLVTLIKDIKEQQSRENSDDLLWR